MFTAMTIVAAVTLVAAIISFTADVAPDPTAKTARSAWIVASVVFQLLVAIAAIFTVSHLNK